MMRKDNDFDRYWNTGLRTLKENGKFYEMCRAAQDKHGNRWQYQLDIFFLCPLTTQSVFDRFTLSKEMLLNFGRWIFQRSQKAFCRKSAYRLH